jgi:phosphoribosylanthranilate isomerase
MYKVKICGIRRQEDVEFVNRYKPDYIGFVFAESKRRVGIETASALGDRLDEGIKKVGVFVNESIENVLKTSLQCGLDIMQLHGDESHEYVEHLRDTVENSVIPNLEIWKAIRVKDIRSLDQMPLFKVDAFILDAFIESAYGGAGKVFDWNLAAHAKKYGNIFLAGGLDLANIQGALETVEPYGVDVSSGVEIGGYKDEEKIKEFINKVREKTYVYK